MSDLAIKATRVLFPVMVDLQLNDPLREFLDQGGCSLLLGETSDEYVSGKMSAERLAVETPERWQRLIEEGLARAGNLLVAADADISAVHRLQGVTRELPSGPHARAMDLFELESVCFEMARGARSVGVNLLLSPTADILCGPNVWLDGRTLSDDAEQAAAMVRTYVQAARRAGIATTLKHFPGHPTLARHPAREEATVVHTLDELRAGWPAFRAGIEAGAEAVMMGPAMFAAVNPPVAGSISAQLIDLLRHELGFDGLVMTCDLDHRSTQRNATLGDVAVAALRAGADLLLISPNGVAQIGQVVAAIVAAVRTGYLPEARLDAAAAAVLKRAATR